MKNKYLLILISVLISCNNTTEEISFTIGEDWINSNVKSFYIDSLTIKTSTFQFDSLMVSNPKRLLIGSYLDPIFGRTESKSYMQISNRIDNYTLNDDVRFDSIALILRYDNYFYNDTIPTHHFSVHTILEDIKPDEENYYNTTTFNIDTAPIGFIDFEPKPYKKDSISIPLNLIFGSEMFAKIQDKEITTTDEFLEDYKGLLVKGTTDNTSVLGFSTNSVLRIYYTANNNDTDEEKTLDFTINNANTFNNISSDKTGTYFSDLTTQTTTLPSTESANRSFIQSGTGIVTKIDIPAIENLYDIPGTGVLIDANLKISLKQNSISTHSHTKDSLKVSIINHRAEVIGVLNSPKDGSELYAVKNIENNEFDKAYYNLPIKQFLDLKLNSPNEKLFLAIYSNDFNASVDRYILNGEENDNNQKIKLEVIYAIYNDE